MNYCGDGAVLGWDRAPKHLFPTLTRHGEWEAWGMSIVCGQDILENAGRWSGVAVSRNERGMWAKVKSVREETPAAAAGLNVNDFILRINGRLVFQMTPKEFERMIAQTGSTLYFDTER